MELPNLLYGLSSSVSAAHSSGSHLSLPLLQRKKSKKLVTLDLKDNNPTNDEWTLVTRSGKHNSSPQRFISSTNNFLIEKLPYNPSVKSLTPITDARPPPVVLAKLLIFPENNSVLGIPINNFAGNNSSSSNIPTGDTPAPMEVSGTNDDDNNNNDNNASELISIGSYNKDDNNNNNNGQLTMSLQNGEPSIESEFKIAFNQNVPIHRDGNRLENVKEILELLYQYLAGHMVLLPTKHKTNPTPSPIKNINTKWPPEAFEYFFYVYSKKATVNSMQIQTYPLK